jgi:hypothetical protein
MLGLPCRPPSVKLGTTLAGEGHGGEVFEELRGVGIRLSDRPRWAKGSTWVIERNGQGWRGTYLEPRTVGRAAAERRPR